MKYLLLLLLPISIFATEQRILLSGFTIHERKEDRFGKKYNAFNYGLGYEYNFFEKYNEIYFGMNTLVLNDSFKNPQLNIGFGHSYRFDMGAVDISLGLSGFAAIKKIYTDKDLDREGGKYKLAGGLGPNIVFYKDNMSVNFMYIPSVKYKELDITGFLFTYFSYKF